MHAPPVPSQPLHHPIPTRGFEQINYEIPIPCQPEPTIPSASPRTHEYPTHLPAPGLPASSPMLVDITGQTPSPPSYHPNPANSTMAPTSIPTRLPSSRLMDVDAVQTPVPPSYHPALLALSQAHVQNVEAAASSHTEPRKGRTCGHCGDQGERQCPGRKESELCPYPCQDCHKIAACLGRDMSKGWRDRPCYDPEVQRRRHAQVEKKIERMVQALTRRPGVG